MYYGLYTKLPELINDRNHYVSNFPNGTYGIWWCRTEDRDQWVDSSLLRNKRFMLDEIV